MSIAPIRALSLALLLSACAVEAPPPPPYASGRPEARLVAVAHPVAFAGGDALHPAERVRLDAFLRDMRLDEADHLHLVADRDDPLAARRLRAVAAFLAGRGLAAEPARRDLGLDPPRDGVALVVERAVVELPDCGAMGPERAADRFANLPLPNFGCATARNLALQVADPRDLVVGRRLAPAEGETAGAAVRAYREGRTKPLIGESTRGENAPQSQR
jgi:pilus assembly protein CpaD